MVPLVRSAFTYAVYFGTAVLILGSLGFNPMPVLAGAGLLGLVIGFGAQSLINDVVSGSFILLENIYLVGDIVEVGEPGASSKPSSFGRRRFATPRAACILSATVT
jgi:moderate conductance mechanosensitive channel